MHEFIIIDGYPYLYTNGKAYACRFDEKGFTPGDEINLTSEPGEIFSEVAIKAQCGKKLDSIKESKRGTKKKVTPDDSND